MNVIDKLLSIIAPYDCLGCGSEYGVLCQECIDAKLPILRTEICHDCGKLSRNSKTCPKCSGTYKPEHVWIACEYADLARQLVEKFKFDHAREAAVPLAEVAQHTVPYFKEIPVLVPVPTAPSHVRERGFDHALLLAREIARTRRWRYASLLARNKGAQQHGLTRNERAQNIKGQFRYSGRYVPPHVLLVDDITTTGATLHECTKVLKQAGVQRVDAVVFARTPKS